MEQFEKFWNYHQFIPFKEEELNTIINISMDYKYITEQLVGLCNFVGLSEAYCQSHFISSTAPLQDCIIQLLHNCCTDQFPQTYHEQILRKYQEILEPENPDAINTLNYQHLFSEILYDMMVIFDHYKIYLIKQENLKTEFNMESFMSNSTAEIQWFQQEQERLNLEGENQIIEEQKEYQKSDNSSNDLDIENGEFYNDSQQNQNQSIEQQQGNDDFYQNQQSESNIKEDDSATEPAIDLKDLSEIQSEKDQTQFSDAVNINFEQQKEKCNHKNTTNTLKSNSKQNQPKSEYPFQYLFNQNLLDEINKRTQGIIDKPLGSIWKQ
eukprot:TRINITY_DN2014_c0_g1_i8.p1 TRINITY_DN2014_c0_g1~~TRINITY_DN2014_c0_g1_i8.p1  ORF type:complete len:324 (-),score=66.99 TRINITY_DN2014_c0_g1_i8:256-1227(-)